MSDLTKLKASVADLTARVKNATTVEAGVATLVQDVVAQNKALAAQIAGMSPDTVTQADLDDLSQQVSDQGTALDQGTTALAKAAAFDPTLAGGAPTAQQSITSAAASPGLGPVGSDAAGQPRVDQTGDKPKPLAGTSPDERAAAAQGNPNVAADHG